MVLGQVAQNMKTHNYMFEVLHSQIEILVRIKMKNANTYADSVELLLPDHQEMLHSFYGVPKTKLKYFVSVEREYTLLKLALTKSNPLLI